MSTSSCVFRPIAPLSASSCDARFSRSSSPQSGLFRHKVAINSTNSAVSRPVLHVPNWHEQEGCRGSEKCLGHRLDGRNIPDLEADFCRNRLEVRQALMAQLEFTSSCTSSWRHFRHFRPSVCSNPCDAARAVSNRAPHTDTQLEPTSRRSYAYYWPFARRAVANLHV